jgi:hypothetical protein
MSKRETKEDKVRGTFFDSSQLLIGVKRIAKKPPINSGTKMLFPTIRKNTVTMMKIITNSAFT